jgi:Leucine-rich repeat (LRR) protein
MKKICAILLVLSLIFSITACASSPTASVVSSAVQPSTVQTAASALDTSTPSPIQTKTGSTDAVSPAPDEEYDPNNFDDWNQAKDAEPKSDNPMAFCNLFPDPYFAYIIAQIFNKKVNDITTFDELASYTGELDCFSTLFGLENIKGIGYMTGITTFTCCKNNLSELPDEFGNLKNLKKVHLQKAFCLEKLTSEIKNCTEIEELWLNMTALKELPPEIGQLKKLKSLGLGTTLITSIPPEVGNCSSLEDLDIHDINIDSVPDSICNLTNLKTLDISHTNLKSLPKNMGNLKRLETLNLFGDQLRTLPQSMKNLKKLTYLNVYDNFHLDEVYKSWFPKEVYTH